MRIGKRGFESRVKGNLRIGFGDERLTSFAGLELVRRFLQGIGFLRELRHAEHAASVGGDVRFGRTVLIVVGMLLAGAKRLRHLRFIGDDPMFLRFTGLSRAPRERSLGRALSRLSSRVWPELDRLSTWVIREALGQKPSKRWTLDIDGSVLSTGRQVERARVGYNPHRRKAPSYYPILATLAQTGHVIGHRNRSGNVHDSHQSGTFLRQTVQRARRELGLDGVLEVRADSAFFKPYFLAACDSLRLEYAIKVGFWPWLNLRPLIRSKAERDWQWVDRRARVQGLFVELVIAAWGRTERIAIYRRRVPGKPAQGHQLDLFNPDDGQWTYSAIATNKSLGLRSLWDFQAGRGAQEKTIGELKNGYAFASIPSRSYRANTAWQKLNLLAHNLVTSLQLRTLASPKSPTQKRTALFRLATIGTLRFEWLNRAARLIRPAGAPTLRLAQNPNVRARFNQIARALPRAA